MTTTVSVSEEPTENYQWILYFPLAPQFIVLVLLLFRFMLTALIVSILATAGVCKK